MIVYGVADRDLDPKLYLAGFIPGVMLASLFSLTVLIFCLSRFRARSPHVVQFRPIGIQCLPHPISDRSTHASADGAR
jgi:TRAP-type C4-dicarboxylate transport system permease large subunit